MKEMGLNHKKIVLIVIRLTIFLSKDQIKIDLEKQKKSTLNPDY